MIRAIISAFAEGLSNFADACWAEKSKGWRDRHLALPSDAYASFLGGSQFKFKSGFLSSQSDIRFSEDGRTATLDGKRHRISFVPRAEESQVGIWLPTREKLFKLEPENGPGKAYWLFVRTHYSPDNGRQDRASRKTVSEVNLVERAEQPNNGSHGSRNWYKVQAAPTSNSTASL